jgi:hypothetical protein
MNHFNKMPLFMKDGKVDLPMIYPEARVGVDSLFANKYQVFLDGHLVRYAVVADQTEGWVDAYVWPFEMGEDGNLIEHRIRGQVEIRRRSHEH